MEDKKYEMKNAHLSMKLLQKCKEGHLEMFCQVPCLNGNFDIRRERENVAQRMNGCFSEKEKKRKNVAEENYLCMER